jgi:hypothetical protein
MWGCFRPPGSSKVGFKGLESNVTSGEVEALLVPITAASTKYPGSLDGDHKYRRTPVNTHALGWVGGLLV